MFSAHKHAVYIYIVWFCYHVVISSSREVWVMSWWRVVGARRTLLLSSSREKHILVPRWEMRAVCCLQLWGPPGSRSEKICPYLNPRNLHLLFTKSHDHLPVPQLCLFMVSWSYSLVHDSVQLSCEILTVTLEAETLLCDVWTSRLMCGVWECCCSLCSADTCPLMTTTAWSSTGRLQ